MEFVTAVAGALLGASATLGVAYASTVQHRRATRLVGSRLLADDFYTFADLVNHAAVHGSWPGPAELVWKPTFQHEMIDMLTLRVGRRSRRRGEVWAAVTSARRTITFIEARWSFDISSGTDPDVRLLRGAFAVIEAGRVALNRLDGRYSQPRQWRQDCSIWSDIAVNDDL